MAPNVKSAVVFYLCLQYASVAANSKGGIKGLLHNIAYTQK